MDSDSIKLKDIKPALSGYIREAQILLNLNPVPDERVVHDVRVLMKKSRAVMRLLAKQVDEDFFEKEYGTYREIGNIMSSWRDNSVYRKIIKDLKKNKPGLFSELMDNQKIGSLLKKPDLPSELMGDINNELTKIKELLYKSAFRIRFRTMTNFDPGLLLNELESTYNISAAKYLTCRNSMKPTDLHEFRKRSKDFLYQLWFFRPLNPSGTKSLEKKLDTMTQNLGKYNDLYQLIRFLGYKYSDEPSSPAMDKLIVLIRHEQDRYLSRVWPAAYKIFCPGRKPSGLPGFRILKYD